MEDESLARAAVVVIVPSGMRLRPSTSPAPPVNVPCSTCQCPLLRPSMSPAPPGNVPYSALQDMKTITLALCPTPYLPSSHFTPLPCPLPFIFIFNFLIFNLFILLFFTPFN